MKGVAGYQATRSNTFLLEPARRGESSFSLRKKNVRFFHCWIKDFRRPKARKSMHVNRYFPRSTLLLSLNNVRTRRSRVFQFKFAYAYISSFATPASPHSVAGDTVD